MFVSTLKCQLHEKRLVASFGNEKHCHRNEVVDLGTGSCVAESLTLNLQHSRLISGAGITGATTVLT